MSPFMTFYLAPDLNSFDAFFDKVVDPAWLERQGKYQGIYDPDAQALKQAKNRANEVWRVLHRVTYVSRVPEQFGSPPAEVIAPAVREPDNIAANWDLIQAVGKLAANLAARDTKNKSKLMILGEAIDQFLEQGQGLGRLLPWWETATNDDKKQEIRKDLLTYLKDYFEIYPWPKDTPVVEPPRPKPPEPPKPPPRPVGPIPRPPSVPKAGKDRALIVLLHRSIERKRWTVVQWKDSAGNWHDTPWKGEFSGVHNGVAWRAETVLSEFGKGPFRWQVFRKEKGQLLATSDPFHLPAAKGETVFVEV